MHAPELIRMGARIDVHGGTATVTGVEQLTGRAGDGHRPARLGFAHIWRVWRPREKPVSARVYHLDRGYEHVVRKLSGVGADIERVHST